MSEVSTPGAQTSGTSNIFVHKLLWQLFLLLFALSFVVTVESATPSDLPAGATPGGVMPDIEKRDFRPSVDTNIFPVPPVIERPLGVDEGPKVVVQSFVLKGIEERRSFISPTTVEEMLESWRVKRPDGFTIGQLQEVANDITKYYRNAGFILAQAYVPTQDVQDGQVIIQISEGRLGEVTTEGNKRYSSELLVSSFQSLLDMPVRKDETEAALLRLTDYPGLNVFGVFKPGEEVGTTNLVLNVKKEKPFELAANLDNYGSEFTGEGRARLDLTVNNPTKVGDQLWFGLLQTINPSNGTYGSVGYERPLFGSRYSAGLSYSINAFEVGKDLAALNIEGETKVGSLFLKGSFIRGRKANLLGSLSLDVKHSLIEQNGGVIGEDNLTVLGAEINFDVVDSRFSGIYQGSVKYSHGFDDFLGSMNSNGDGLSTRKGVFKAFAGGDFDKLKFRLSRLQSLTKNQSLLFVIEGQHSDDLLTSLEQMSIGGPNSVRAYPVAEFLRDKAWFASMEWIMNAPGFADKSAFANRNWGEVFQLSMFVDYGGGILNDPLASDDERIEVTGAGLGFQLKLPGTFLVRVDVAAPISARNASNNRDPQYYLTAHYDF